MVGGLKSNEASLRCEDNTSPTNAHEGLTAQCSIGGGMPLLEPYQDTLHYFSNWNRCPSASHLEGQTDGDHSEPNILEPRFTATMQCSKDLKKTLCRGFFYKHGTLDQRCPTFHVYQAVGEKTGLRNQVASLVL